MNSSDYYKKQKGLRDLFKLLIPYLNKHNITYWLEAGTLLGFYRDKNIICKDNDIDISILDEGHKIKKLLKDIRKDNKLNIINNCKIPQIMCIYRVFDKKNKDVADLQIRMIDKDYLKVIGDNKFLIKNNILPIKKEFVFPLKSAKFIDNIVNIPNNTEAMLEYYYGKDYMKKIYKCNDACTKCD